MEYRFPVLKRRAENSKVRKAGSGAMWQGSGWSQATLTSEHSPTPPLWGASEPGCSPWNPRACCSSWSPAPSGVVEGPQACLGPSQDPPFRNVPLSLSPISSCGCRKSLSKILLLESCTPVAGELPCEITSLTHPENLAPNIAFLPLLCSLPASS